MGIIPRLQLGTKIPGGGVKPTGAHLVKFIGDKLVTGKDPITKEPRQEVEYLVEKNGTQFRWNVPLYDKKTKQPHYLMERLVGIEEGDEVVLEMKKSGIINYIDVRKVSDSAEPEEEVIQYDEMSEEEEVNEATK